MNFIPYVFKKDLNRLKVVLLVWFLLIVGQSALSIGGTKMAADMFQFQMILPMLTMLLNFLQGMMILVLVPLVIQEDAFVGTTAFWFTRPISKKAMMITKLTFIGVLLIILPLIAEIFVLAVNGVNAHHIVLAVPEIILEKLAFMIPFLLLAVLTPKISRYALVGISVFAGLTLSGIIGSVAAIFLPALAKFIYNFDLYNSPSLEASASVAKDIYAIVIGMALVVHQCLTGDSRRTIGWFVVAYLCMTIFSKAWSIDFMGVETDAVKQATISDTLQMKIDTNYSLINDQMRYRKDDSREKSISVKAYATGLPKEQFANLRKLSNVRIYYPSETIINSGYVSPQTRQSSSNEKFMPAIQAALGDVKVVNPFLGKFTHTEIITIKDGDIAAHKEKVGSYAAVASYDVYEYKKVAELPLVQGSREAFASQQVIVYDVLEGAQGISVIVGEKKTNLLFDRSSKKKSRYDMARDIYSDYKSVYAIINRGRGEAFLAESGGNLDFDMSEVYGQARLQTRAKQFDFNDVNDRNSNLPKIDKEWMAGAQLVRLDAVRIGSKDVDVKIENFIIPTQTTSVKTQMDEYDQEIREQDRQMRKMGVSE